MTATAAPIVPPPAGRHRGDPARTTVAVTARHLFGLGAATAMSAPREAGVAVGDAGTATMARAVIDAGGFAGGNSERDGDIRSPESLDTATPDITVEIRPVARGKGSWTGVSPPSPRTACHNPSRYPSPTSGDVAPI